MKATVPSRPSEEQSSEKLPEGQESSGYVKPAPPELDPVDEAAEESFPASDPPSFTGATATPNSRKPHPHPSP